MDGSKLNDAIRSRAIREYELPHFLGLVEKKGTNLTGLISKLNDTLPGDAPVTVSSVASALERSIEDSQGLGQGLQNFLYTAVTLYNENVDGKRRTNTDVAESLGKRFLAKYEGNLDEKTLLNYLKAAEKDGYRIHWKNRFVEATEELVKKPSMLLKAATHAVFSLFAISMALGHGKVQATSPKFESPPISIGYPSYQVSPLERELIGKVAMKESGPEHGAVGVEAVIDLILNRYEHPVWQAPIPQLLVPGQFSVLKNNPDYFAPGVPAEKFIDPNFVQMTYFILDSKLNGRTRDITNGATTFNNSMSPTGGRDSTGNYVFTGKFGGNYFFKGDKYDRNLDGTWAKGY